MAPAPYATGQAYAVGTVVKNGVYLYRLDNAFTGTGLSVTAPTNTPQPPYFTTTASADNGGTWTYLYAANAANYLVYAYNPTNLTIMDSDVRSAPIYNVWLDGTASGASGFRAYNSRFINAGTDNLYIGPGILTGANSNVSNVDVSGAGTLATNINALAGQVFFRNLTGYVSSNSGLSSAIATGATVSHGLAGTPVTVTLTAADGTPTAVYPSALGATTFTVNYTGGGTHQFYWTAKLAGDP